MIRRKFIYAALGMVLLATAKDTCAQKGGLAESNAPLLGTGQMPRAVPGDDRKPTNVLQISIAATGRFDDNAQIGSAQRRSDMTYSVEPSLAFVQTLRRLEWGLSYGPGLVISQHRLFSGPFTHDFGGHFTWLMSKRGTLSVQQNYILSPDPFQRFGSQPFTTTPGPMDAPNQSIYLPNVRRTSSLSQAQYSYRLGARTTFGIGGSFGFERYDNMSSSRMTTDLLNSQIASGQANISRRFSPRNQIGFQYGATAFKFQQVNARTTTHSFLIFDEVKLTQNSSLSLYAGAQYSMISNQAILNSRFLAVPIPVKGNTWTWSGGGVYSLTRNRTAMVFNYSHRISNGSGFMAAVEADAGSAEVSWNATKNWTLSLDLQGANNRLLAVKTENELRTYSAGVGLGRRLFRNMSINLSFERLNQTGPIAGLRSQNHNIAIVSIAYDFLKPVGR